MHLVIDNILENIQQVIIGKDKIIKYMLACLLSDGHILLEGVPGVGKTKLAISLARSVEGKYKRIQFTPDVLPSDITGFYIYNKKIGEFEYREGAAMCNFLLADEINRASPRVQSSLLEAMEERQITVEGVTLPLPTPFMVIATQNGLESQGTYPLPEAQLDRFFMKLNVDYPKRNEWNMILQKFEEFDSLKALHEVVTLKKLETIKEEIKDIVVSDLLRSYILDLVEAIRAHEMVQVGISPRGTIALVKAARSWAFINNRSFVLPDDVQEMATPVLAHRLLLEPSAQWNNIHKESIIEEVVASVKVPIF